MEYRTPTGEKIFASRAKLIKVQLEDGDRVSQFPSIILDRQTPEKLHQYGYRRIIHGPIPDAMFYTGLPSSDLSQNGIEHITYIVSPKYSPAQARAFIMEKYFEEIRPVVTLINEKIAMYDAIGLPAKVVEWQALWSEVRPKYLQGAAEFQRIGALSIDQQYDAYVAMWINISDYIVQIPEGIT